MPNELLIKVLIEFFFFVFKCSIIGVIMKYVDDSVSAYLHDLKSYILAGIKDRSF